MWLASSPEARGPRGPPGGPLGQPIGGRGGVLRGGHLVSYDNAHGTLLLQGEGRGVLALLRDCHDDLDGGDGGDQCGVSGGRRGIPSDVANERTRGREARG
jgi:hypothetical protein